MTQRVAPAFDLLLITEPALAHPVTFATRMLATLSVAEARRVAVQLRAKSWSLEQRRVAALKLRTITRDAGCALIINGDLDVCVEADADGVQLPVLGASAPEARAIVGLHRYIGASCHGHHELLAADAGGADFAVLSPWGDVPDKGRALGAEAFEALARSVAIPVYALGGIGVDDVTEVRRRGARGIAVLRQAHQASDPAQWVRTMLTQIDSTKDRRVI